MGRKRKTKRFSILFADTVAHIGEDRVYVPDSEPQKSLMEQLNCPAADEVFIALRKAFSLTYPRNPFVDGVQSALTEIRRIGVEAHHYRTNKNSLAFNNARQRAGNPCSRSNAAAAAVSSGVGERPKAN